MALIPRRALPAIFDALELDAPLSSLWGSVGALDDESRAEAQPLLQDLDSDREGLFQLIAVVSWPEFSVVIGADGRADRPDRLYIVGVGDLLYSVAFGEEAVEVQGPLDREVLCGELADRIGAPSEPGEYTASFDEFVLARALLESAIAEDVLSGSPVSQEALRRALVEASEAAGASAPAESIETAILQLVESGLLIQAGDRLGASEATQSELAPLLTGSALSVRRWDGPLAAQDDEAVLEHLLTSERDYLFVGSVGDRWLLAPGSSERGSITLLRLPREELLELFELLLVPREYPARSPVSATTKHRELTADAPEHTVDLISNSELLLLHADIVSEDPRSPLAATLYQPEECIAIEGTDERDSIVSRQISILGEWCVAWEPVAEGLAVEIAPRTECLAITGRLAELLAGPGVPAGGETFTVAQAEAEETPSAWANAPSELSEATTLRWFALSRLARSGELIEGEEIRGLSADGSDWKLEEQLDGSFEISPLDRAAVIASWEKSHPRVA